MINSQLAAQGPSGLDSISKGMGDQFSALVDVYVSAEQYIKGDG